LVRPLVGRAGGAVRARVAATRRCAPRPRTGEVPAGESRQPRRRPDVPGHRRRGPRRGWLVAEPPRWTAPGSDAAGNAAAPLELNLPRRQGGVMPNELLNRVDVEFLHPGFRERLLEMLIACLKAGFDYWAISGYRSPREQQELYEQGRLKPG